MSAPTTPPPTTRTTIAPAKSFAMQAASLSVLAPLASPFIFVLLLHEVEGTFVGILILDVVIALVNMAGLALGIAALVSARRHGGPNVYVRASIGIFMCALLAFFMVGSVCTWVSKENQQEMQHQP